MSLTNGPFLNDATERAGDDRFDVWLDAGRVDRQYWRDLWRYRELFLILAWRDVAVRYKQTVAGLAWAVLQPLLALTIMTVIFGRVAGLPPAGQAPYALMVSAAMLPWQFFANAFSTASQSVVSNSSLVSKVYFPRLIIPSSAIVVAFVDFIVSCSILTGLMAWYGVWPTWRLIVLPAFIVLTILAAAGPGVMATALMVRYRDFRFLVPFVVQFGLYVSPVAYSSAVARSALGDRGFFLYSVNPMVGVIDGFRWAVLPDMAFPDPRGFLISVACTFCVLAFGLRYFRRTERLFADVI